MASAQWPSWDALVDGKATAKLKSQAEKQESFAKALLDKDKGIDQSINLLIAQHSKSKSKDPCALAKFRFKAAEIGDKTLDEFGKEADAKCEDLQKQLESYTAALDSHKGAVDDDKHEEKAQSVRSEMDGALNKLSDLDQSLARVASREKGQDRDTVLAEVLGEHTLSEDARDDAFKAEWGKRISVREDAARQVVKALLAAKEHRDAIDACFEESFEEAKGEALQTKERVENRILRLKESISTGETQLRQLEDVKKQKYEDLSKKREELKKVILRVLELSEKVMDLDIEHAALGLQQEVTTGKLDLERTRLKEMAPAADLAAEKLAHLHVKALEFDSSAQEKRKLVLKEVVPKVNSVLQAGALRKQVAIHLSRKMIEQKDTEIRSLEGKLTAQEAVLQCSLTGTAGSPQELRMREARLQTSMRKLKEQKSECHSTRGDMDRDLQALLKQYSDLKELHTSGATIDHEDCAAKAAKLADGAHTDFLLFGTGSEAVVSEEVDPRSEANSLQLAVLPAAFKDLFQSVMKNEIEALVEARVRQVLAERAGPADESDAGTTDQYNVIDDNGQPVTGS